MANEKATTSGLTGVRAKVRPGRGAERVVLAALDARRHFLLAGWPEEERGAVPDVEAEHDAAERVDGGAVGERVQLGVPPRGRACRHTSAAHGNLRGERLVADIDAERHVTIARDEILWFRSALRERASFSGSVKIFDRAGRM